MTAQPSEQIRARTPAKDRFLFEPIPAATLQQIRAAGVDEAGNRPTAQVDSNGGNGYGCYNFAVRYG
jgi:hypothetical protein